MKLRCVVIALTVLIGACESPGGGDGDRIHYHGGGICHDHETGRLFECEDD